MIIQQNILQKPIAEYITDEQDFITLMQHNQERVYRLAYHLLGDAEEAKDAVQEVFIRVWKKKKSIRLEDARPWLMRTTINLCLDWLRRRKFRGNSEELTDQIRDQRLDPLEECIDNEVQVILKSAIQRLPAKYRVVLIMRDMEGMSYDEISEMLDVPMSKVKSDLFRGRRRIRELLRSFIEVNK